MVINHLLNGMILQAPPKKSKSRKEGLGVLKEEMPKKFMSCFVLVRLKIYSKNLNIYIYKINTLLVIYFLNFPPYISYMTTALMYDCYILTYSKGKICEGVSSNHPTTPIANLLLKTKQGLPFSLQIMPLASG